MARLGTGETSVHKAGDGEDYTRSGTMVGMEFA
jgi:hypothetical protein